MCKLFYNYDFYCIILLLSQFVGVFMSNKKTKLCLLMLVMLLGACSFSNDVAFAKNEASITEVNQDDIKANKEHLFDNLA